MGFSPILCWCTPRFGAKVGAMKVYIKPGCPWCVEAVAYLRGEGFEFEEIDVIADAAAFDEMRSVSGQTKAPTMVLGDLVLPDFDVGELKAFFAQHGIESP